jgi:hypothetical protein
MIIKHHVHYSRTFTISKLEAATGFGPVIRVLQTRALPLGYAAMWSGKRDSNPRHSAWEADALPTELLPLVYLPTKLDNYKNIIEKYLKIKPRFFIPSHHLRADVSLTCLSCVSHVSLTCLSRVSHVSLPCRSRVAPVSRTFRFAVLGLLYPPVSRTSRTRAYPYLASCQVLCVGPAILTPTCHVPGF